MFSFLRYFMIHHAKLMIFRETNEGFRVFFAETHFLVSKKTGRALTLAIKKPPPTRWRGWRLLACLR